MPKPKMKPATVEIRSYKGKSGTRYLLVRGWLRGDDFFDVFEETELKKSCQDIIGEAAKPTAKAGGNEMARYVWGRIPSGGDADDADVR